MRTIFLRVQQPDGRSLGALLGDFGLKSKMPCHPAVGTRVRLSLMLMAFNTGAGARELPRAQTKVYLDISIDGKPSGRVGFDTAPAAAAATGSDCLLA